MYMFKQSDYFRFKLVHLIHGEKVHVYFLYDSCIAALNEFDMDVNRSQSATVI